MTALRGEWRKNFPMAKLSSWKVGGPADALFLPADADDLRAFWEEDSRAASAFFIGHGSNILARDGGVEGVTVRCAPGLSGLRLEKDGAIVAEAGVGCPKLARFAADAGLPSAAFLAGIPGTVGGALAMNAGCEGGEIWKFVESVFALSAEGAADFLPSDFNIGYRSAVFRKKGPLFFVAARLRFDKPDSDSLSSDGDDDSNAKNSGEDLQALRLAARRRIKTLLERRRQTQPIESANCGSVFCNPPGDFAARLIEAAGLKGAAAGGARVSEKHANFIINDGNATAADIENLIVAVRNKVRETAGVDLQPEVRIVGRQLQ